MVHVKDKQVNLLSCMPLFVCQDLPPVFRVIGSILRVQLEINKCPCFVSAKILNCATKKQTNYPARDPWCKQHFKKIWPCFPDKICKLMNLCLN